MYIHIGLDYVLNENDIIGIFDFDTLLTSEISKTHLKELESDNRLISISDDIPKSVTIALLGGNEVAYLSPLSSKTIANRKIVL